MFAPVLGSLKQVSIIAPILTQATFKQVAYHLQLPTMYF